MSTQASIIETRRDMPTRLFDAAKRLVYLGQVTIQTRSLTAARLFWSGRRKPNGGMFRFPFGLVRYTDYIALESMYRELFLEQVYEVKSLPDAPRIVDCGGNIGMSVIWFKQRYPQASITVFEADPTLADVLAENVQRLGLTSVEVVKAAVSGVAGRMTFTRDRAMTGHLSAEGELTINCVRLSERLDEPVDLLKVDIEGSEYSLLSDLCATGKIKLVKHLICEVHASTQHQEQFGDLWNGLCKAGFKVTISGAFTHGSLFGEPDPTPFASVDSGKYLLWLYAWRPDA